MKNKRKICVVTTSRADYGLLYWIMREILEDRRLQLQTIATGMHLSPEFGSTYRKIEQDGFVLDRKCHMLLSSDCEVATVKSIGVGLMSFADALKELLPDIVVILGDRFELFSVAIAALILRIPIAHIHGGETTQGAFDEAVRHSVSKMSSIHFAATEVYGERIIQMGEDPNHVFNFGAPGLDFLYREAIPNKTELERLLGFDLSGRVALVTYHPETLHDHEPTNGFESVLTAITRSKLKAIFTQANADPGGRKINDRSQAFCAKAPDRYKFLNNLGQRGYFGALKNLDLMIGNSSSGLTEAPSLGLPVVNIGDRQKGRVRAGNIIDVGRSTAEIKRGIEIALSAPFRKSARQSPNPYDPFRDGKTSYRIKEALRTIKLGEYLIKKQFHDLRCL
jgi:UDP-hydrolysing UDP-N-acetyl-D-glucosamine 2-epimerase